MTPLLSDYYPVLLLCLAVGGFWVHSIGARWLRYMATAVLILAPALLIFLDGVWTGCALRVGGEECMWYGFGLVLSLVYIVPLAAVVVGLGLLLGHMRNAIRNDS